MQNCGGESQWLIYAKAANLRIENMTQISKINSVVLTVYATDANMYINVKGNVPGGMTMAELIKEKIIGIMEYIHFIKVKSCCTCKYFCWYIGSAGICGAKNGCAIKRMKDWSDVCDCGSFKIKWRG